jgi:hypothetical protein
MRHGFRERLCEQRLWIRKDNESTSRDEPEIESKRVYGKALGEAALIQVVFMPANSERSEKMSIPKGSGA